MRATKWDFIMGVIFLVFFFSLVFYNKFPYAGYAMGITGILIVALGFYKKVNESQKDDVNTEA